MCFGILENYKSKNEMLFRISKNSYSVLVARLVLALTVAVIYFPILFFMERVFCGCSIKLHCGLLFACRRTIIDYDDACCKLPIFLDKSRRSSSFYCQWHFQWNYSLRFSFDRRNSTFFVSYGVENYPRIIKRIAICELFLRITKDKT